MLKTLKNLLSKRPERAAKTAGYPETIFNDEDIPRYPPFVKGFPASTVQQVVKPQSELIERVRAALGFNKEEFEKLVMPVIYNYAALVHLLPASESHHHRGAGGLFRHGLEVAFWATQASESVIFSMEGSPMERRNNEPRWRLASCFAGLLHDVGKPLSDLSISDKSGDSTWDPLDKTLYEWARDKEDGRYFLRWRENRHKRHERFAMMVIPQLLHTEAKQYLMAGGPVIMDSLLDALQGGGLNHPVTRLMIRADQESVTRDLKNSRLNVDAFAYGVPIERFVFDAIRRLVKTGKWKVNEPGAHVWNLHQGTFIVWRSLTDLYGMFNEGKISGIPQDLDTLADTLLERDMALPHEVVNTETGEVAQYRYWDFKPEMLQENNVQLRGLRIASSEYVFTTEPPPPVKAWVSGDEIEDVELASLTEKKTYTDNPHFPDDTDAGLAVSTTSANDEAGSEEEKVEQANKALDELFSNDGSDDFPFEDSDSDAPGTAISTATPPVVAVAAAIEEPTGQNSSSQGEADSHFLSGSALERSATAGSGDPDLLLDVLGISKQKSAPKTTVAPPAHAKPKKEAAEPVQNKQGAKGSKPAKVPTEKTVPVTDKTEPALSVDELLGTDSSMGVDFDSLFPSKQNKHAEKPAQKEKVKPKSEPLEKALEPVKPKPTVETKPKETKQVKPAPTTKAKAAPKPAARKELLSDFTDSTVSTPAEKNAPKEQLTTQSAKPKKAPTEQLRISERDNLLTKLGSLDEKSCGWLTQAATSVLDGQSVLGETLFKLQGRLAIVYPEGAASLGQPAEVRSHLWEAGLLDSDPALNMGVQAHEGVEGLMLTRSIAELIEAALSESIAVRESIGSVLADGVPGHDKAQRKTAPAVQTDHTKTSKAKTNKAKTQQDSSEPKQASMVFIRPKPKHVPTPSIAEKSVVRSDIEIPELDSDELLVKGEGTLTCEIDDIHPNPKPIDRYTAVAELKKMIQKGEGKWLAGPVRSVKHRRGMCLATSGMALDVIASQYPELSKAALRSSLANQKTQPLMFIDGGDIYLKSIE